ncbi:profilin-3-like [Salvelinus alpinus]|uniref:Profilin n=1 Tax=Salvelinus namaycush TaxID=8040 RepID=A0A8U0UDD1_SALNM|nr:profilin-3 [Salvelinus alpinus]XP_038848555.1 profilin-3-like [Salvelinus namaycush]XP_055780421.1 profilin-3-like [Salvelinus fontinalis]
MAEWRDYIKATLKEKFVEDVAIVGLYDNKAVWASKPGGVLAAICPLEVEALVGKDRGSLLQEGVSVGGRKMAVIRDHMTGPETEILFIDIRTKGSESLALTVALTTKALVFVMGKRGVHGGIVNKKVCDMAKYLRERGV